MFYERGIKISSRAVILFLGDLLCIGISIIGSAFLRLTPEEGWAYVLEHIPSLGGSCAIFLVVFYISGVYERQTLLHKRGCVAALLASVIISLVVIAVVFYARFKLHIGRGILLLAALFIFLSAWFLRYLYGLAVGYGFFKKNALIVGEGEEALNVIKLLNRTENAGYKIYGVVDSTKSNPGGFIEGVLVLGYIDKLREFARVYDVETVIVATPLRREYALLKILRPLRYAGIEIIDYVNLYEELAQEIPIDHIDDEWLMYAAMNSSRIHIRKIKRIMDITASFVGLIVSAPICLVAAILIKLDSAGPVLYRQRRAGLDGKSCTVTKFRTVSRDAEKDSGAVWAGRFDTRVTRVGRLLRKSRIDEIPQLVNVLRGEMSLVGPRPERPEFIEALAEAIPFYKERLLIPPGVTGWAQIRYPYAASVDAARIKLQFDLYYIKHMSFFLDLLILLRTFKTIMMGMRHSEDFVTEEQQEQTVLCILPDDAESKSSRSA